MYVCMCIYIYIIIYIYIGTLGLKHILVGYMDPCRRKTTTDTKQNGPPWFGSLWLPVAAESPGSLGFRGGLPNSD